MHFSLRTRPDQVMAGQNAPGPSWDREIEAAPAIDFNPQNWLFLPR
jgi:hypothetical protein